MTYLNIPGINGDGSDTICVCMPPEAPPEPNCDIDSQYYDWTYCPYFVGGIHWNGCDKWLGSTAEADLRWDSINNVWVSTPVEGHVCLDDTSEPYDITSENV